MNDQILAWHDMDEIPVVRSRELLIVSDDGSFGKIMFLTESSWPPPNWKQFVWSYMPCRTKIAESIQMIERYEQAQDQLDAVMQLGIDKWLNSNDHADLDNPAQRACRAREQTLCKIESLQTQVHKLNDMIKAAYIEGHCNASILSNEVARSSAAKKAWIKSTICTMLSNMMNGATHGK